MVYIYMITSPTGRRYVGKTTDIERRKNEYRNHRSFQQKLIFYSIKKYGFDAHLFEILEICGSEDWKSREIFWIKEKKSYYHLNKKGLNLTIGGEPGGNFRKHTLKQRKKLSNIKRTIRSVFCYSLEGKFLGRYGSMNAAAKKHSTSTSNVHSVLKGKMAQCNGIRYFEKKQFNIKKIVGNVSPIVQLDLNGNFIKRYNSVTDAVSETGFIGTSIVRCAKGQKTITAHNYMWIYESDYNPLLAYEKLIIPKKYGKRIKYSPENVIKLRKLIASGMQTRYAARECNIPESAAYYIKLGKICKNIK